MKSAKLPSSTTALWTSCARGDTRHSGNGVSAVVLVQPSRKKLPPGSLNESATRAPRARGPIVVKMRAFSAADWTWRHSLRRHS
ncbi:hypothetical protein HPB47_021000 [Ixodes persulcatus]|uniref:Uncharacterized protein n=1 Tax=Ixodes persulcatus TaxID=34615 RepID=A0AC60QHD5_IXOPE|nr:hypothetical protein HPB47_021000 [Ixodes persulcatus]